MIPVKQDLLDAYTRVKPWVHRTPILTSHQLNDWAGATLCFKCENLQKMGAFKMRGAVNAIQSLQAEQKKAGVVTHSSGNFGQAVALAAKNLGIPAYIVMPNNAPEVKVAAVKGYGGEVIFCEPTLQARETAANEIVKRYGATFLHPSNQIEVILGNASAALELLEDTTQLEYVVSPVGGGGLLAGTALAVHYFGNGTKTVGAEPQNVDDAYRSLQSGKIEDNEATNTIADGLRTHLGDVNFPILKEYVDGIVRVTEEEIVEAMKLLWERMKIVVEPSSAVALAAVRKDPERFANKKVGIILSGGNVDLSKLPF